MQSCMTHISKYHRELMIELEKFPTFLACEHCLR